MNACIGRAVFHIEFITVPGVGFLLLAEVRLTNGLNLISLLFNLGIHVQLF